MSKQGAPAGGDTTSLSLAPCKTGFAETFGDQHQSRAVPKQDLQRIRPLEPEYYNQPRMRIEAERNPHEPGKHIMPAAKIDNLI